MTKADHWKTRLTHEAQLHDETSFVTLTYSDANLPDDYSVHVDELQRFMKRLRFEIAPTKVRYFACGEYGERNARPHYHLLLFGYQFPDITPWRRTSSGHVTYRSAILERLWPLGHSEIGTFTPSSAGYVARYVLKKVGGDLADAKYSVIHPFTGEQVRQTPEFIIMSSRPGIGYGWFEKYKSDVFPSDFCIIDGQKRPMPPYYKKKLAEAEALKITQQRKEKAKPHADNNTTRRLLVRDEHLTLKVERLKRDLDNP